jgi:hypothetical protein
MKQAMANITLKGTLNVMGNITFKGDKLMIDTAEALVQANAKQGDAPPVMLPPPPAGPTFPQPDVWVISSFNQTVKQKDKTIVVLGMVMQGPGGKPWPGMIMPSVGNSTVTINHIPVNVKNDQAVIFPSGGTAVLSVSGQ